MDIKFNLDTVDQTFSSYKTNQIYSGVVVSKQADGFIFNIGGKKDAFIPNSEIDGDIKVGDRFSVLVTSKTNELGQVVASKRLADATILGNQNAAGIRLGKAFTCVLTDIKEGNLISRMGDYQIIVPEGEISSAVKFNPRSFLGRQIEAVAIEIDHAAKRVIASIKVLTDQTKAQNEEIFWRVNFINKIVSGTVKKNMPYGSFVSVNGVDCFLHISDISFDRLQHPSERLEEGKEYQFKILKMDKENKKVSIGMKQLEDSKRLLALKSLKSGQSYEGEVIKLLPFGAIIRLENGVDGLLHINDATEDKRKSIQEMVKLEQRVMVKVLSADAEKERVSFTLL